MEPLLTAEELEALKQAQQPLDGRVREVRSVDLIACDHRAFSLMPELQGVSDRFAAGLERALTKILRTPAKSDPRPVEIVPGRQLRELWGDPRFVYGGDVDGQREGGAVAIDAFLGGAFVSRQFGGAIEMPVLDRPATKTERRTVARLAQRVSEEMVDALRPMAEIEVVLRPERTKPLASAAVVLFAVDVNIGEHKGRVAIAIDTTCSCFERRPKQETTSDGASRRGELLPALGQVGVEVRANLGRRPITMREYFALAPGDVLTLDTPVDTEIDLLVAEKRKFVGVPLLQHGLLSVRITDLIKE